MGKEGGGLLSFSLSADDIFFCQGVTFTFCLLQISKAQFLSGLMGQLPHKTCPPANIYPCSGTRKETNHRDAKESSKAVNKT